MHRVIVPLMLVLLAMGIGGCREIKNPKSGYLIVPDTGSAVSIRTSGLEGAGWIKAFTSSQQWDVIHLSPNGSFAFNDVLPDQAWHCASPFGTQQGCFAALRVGDEGGAISTPKSGRIYVCTQDYNDWDGRKKCGKPTIAVRNLMSSEYVTKTMSDTKSHTVPLQPGALPFNVAKDWKGSKTQRLFTGTHTFVNEGSYSPAPNEDGAVWTEYQSDPATFTPPLTDPTLLPGDTLYSVDVGMSNVFIPWRWDDRFIGGEFTPDIGAALGNLGLGELFVDRLIDQPISQSIYTQDAKKWLNVLNEIGTRADVSPEFHFRVNEDGDRQICMVQYVWANNRINGRPDEWWRLDQGFAALFVQWFGLGDCRTKHARIQYCGEIGYSPGAPPSFTIEPESVKAVLEDYSAFKPLCRKRFKPEFEAMIPQMLIGPAQAATEEGLASLIGAFQLLTGGTIRRIETTPLGIYLVMADYGFDSQYGIGDTIREVEGGANGLHNRHHPSSAIALPATGITRPLQ